MSQYHSAQVEQSHKDNELFIHGFEDQLKPYSNLVSPSIFMLDGVRIPQCTSALPKHFSTAVSQAASFTIYNQRFFSHQSIDSLNWFLAPFAFNDHTSAKEMKQLLQGLVFKLGQLSEQTCTINLDTTIPAQLAEQKVILNGKRIEENYKSFGEQAETIYRTLIEIMQDGQAAAKPFTTPVLSTRVKGNEDFENELWAATINAVAVHAPIHFSKQSQSHGSNSVVSINLPRLSLIAKNETKFFRSLDLAVDRAKRALLERNSSISLALNEHNSLKFLENKTIEKTPYYSLRDRKLSISIIGLNECALNLVHESLDLKQGLAFGQQVVKRIDSQIKKFNNEQKLFELAQTPADDGCSELALADRKKFGEKANLQGRKPDYFYSNGAQLPLNTELTAIEKARSESELHRFFSQAHSIVKPREHHPQQILKLVKELSKLELKSFAFA